MVKKALLNIFLNIGILCMVLSIIWLFNHQYYPLLIGALFALALFIYLKIRLVKSVKALIRENLNKKGQR